MKKEIFAICDPEVIYTERLMDYVYKKYGDSFEIQAFTSVEKLCAFVEKHSVAVLLIAAHTMNDKVKALGIERIILLSEGDIKSEFSEYQTVYKYQASPSMMAEVMEYYAVRAVKAPHQLLKQKMRIIAVYSPVSRVLKTSFALTLGMVMAKNSSTLYLNMESYSGFSKLLKKEFTSDFSDLLYFLRRGSGNLVYKAQGMTQSLEQLDYLPPFFSPEDLKSVSVNEWLELLRIMREESTYETVIVDIGEGVRGIFEILEMCDDIYMPMREDVLSNAKIAQYEEVLSAYDYSDIRDKTRKVKLPFYNGFGSGEQYFSQLAWGELGDYVRNLLREERK